MSVLNVPPETGQAEDGPNYTITNGFAWWEAIRQLFPGKTKTGHSLRPGYCLFFTLRVFSFLALSSSAFIRRRRSVDRMS
jgi:hypothetical protein